MEVKAPRYQKRKVKKRLIVMHILSQAPTKEKITKEEVNIQGIMATKMSHHKEDLFLPCTKVSFMVFFSCNNFGHRNRDCKAYGKKAWEINGGVHMNYNVEC